MSALLDDLSRLAQTADVELRPVERTYLADATAAQAILGSAEAVLAPGSVDGVAAAMAWCYEHGVPITPRGGGTGYAGGAVPHGGVVLATDRLRGVRSLVPLSWRAELEAGLTTADVRRLARENGLYFPPDPGAAEQSLIGGNVATDAGGPHAFKYGTTGAWVTGVEAVVPPGRVVRFGGALRKDVAGYDLRALLVGSEGTLGVITAVTLRFVPPPERRFPVVGFYPDERRGGEAVRACLASGIVPAALEFLDQEAVEIVRGAMPLDLPSERCFAVIAEADGTEAEARAGREALLEALAEGALRVDGPTGPATAEALWRWRDGVGLAADAALGGKASEDVGVPVERLGEAVAGTRGIGRRHGLSTCSWGHAGDGNLHSTFLFDRTDPKALARVEAATEDLFTMAIELGGTVSGEHGIGTVKAGQLRRQWNADAVSLHRAVKSTFDPEGLLNPGKKLP